MSAPVVIAPSFPRRTAASDGQSVYVVESAHALAARRGPLRAIALRLEGEPPHERDGPIEIVRVDPGVSIATPFALYEASHFERVMARLASEATRLVPAGAPVLVHGYELGPTAAALAARGHRVVAVLHYLLAQELEHYLAGADDPFRRSVMPPALGLLAAAWPARARGLLAGAAGRSARRLSHPAFSKECSPRRTRTEAGGASGREGPERASRSALGAIVGSASERLGADIVRHQLGKLAMEQQLFAAADLAVGVSEGFAEAMRRFHPRARIVFCHAGRPEDVSEARWSPSERIRLLAVGRPTPQKGWDVLARALGHIEADEPAIADRLSLTVVGGTRAWAGPHSAFGAETRRALTSLSRVVVHDAGRLDRAELLARYGEADVLVHPSDYEPFGLVLLEAMSAGCPVLALDTDGARDVIEDGRSGWLVRAGGWKGRSTRLAAAIAALTRLDEPAWRARRAAAHARARSFSWDRTAEALDRWLSGAAR